jgi:hypothetical protein
MNACTRVSCAFESSRTMAHHKDFLCLMRTIGLHLTRWEFVGWGLSALPPKCFRRMVADE